MPASQNLQDAVRRRFEPAPLQNNPAHPPLSTQQLNCCAHAYRILRDRRAVFLCEPTGTGKTFVASKLALTALAHTLCHSVCVVAPAHLRAIWLNVTARFSLTCTFISYQMASLNKLPSTTTNALILVDEAHYLKSASTQRYQNLIHFFHANYICLITATPVSLGLSDLSSLMNLCGFPTALPPNEDFIKMFALALMPSAYTAPLQLNAASRLTRQNITYQINVSPPLNRLSKAISQTQWPVFSSNGTETTSLISQILVHRFMSHPASCRASLKRLQRYYAQCTKTGALRPVSRAEFKHIFGFDGIQLPLPFGLPDDLPPSEDTFRLLDHIRTLLAQTIHDLDLALNDMDPKLSALKSVVQNTHGKLLLFTQYADTARYVARFLNQFEPTAMLTSNEATFRSLNIDRDFLQNLFDPDYTIPQTWLQAQLPVPRLLVATDTLSTGHNLQRADTVIHLDSPWNPTVMKQREGRILRNNQSSKHLHFFSFQMTDAPTELLDAYRRLQQKLSSRSRLQMTWNSITSIHSSTTTLFSPSPDNPALWILAQNTWLPVHPRFAALSDASPIPSLAHALLTYQHPASDDIKNFSDDLKHARHQSDLDSLISKLEHFSNLTALWPQLRTTSSDDQQHLFTMAAPDALLSTAYISNA